MPGSPSFWSYIWRKQWINWLSEDWAVKPPQIMIPPYYPRYWFPTKMQNSLMEERIIFPTNDSRATRYADIQRNKLRSLPHTRKKKRKKWAQTKLKHLSTLTLHMNVYSSIIHKSQILERIQTSIWWMDKQNGTFTQWNNIQQENEMKYWFMINTN